MKEEEVIDSLELEDFLTKYLNDSENSLQEKIEVSNFLCEYIDKNLFVVTVVKDWLYYLRVENENDEIVSEELFIGKVIPDKESETKEDFETLHNDANISKMVKEYVQTYDKFVLKNLDTIKHKYVGWRVKKPEPNIGESNFFTENYCLKVQINMEFIGFDDKEDIEYYANQHYNICSKSDLEKVRGII